jgi:topoisomerase-4 subunit A
VPVAGLPSARGDGQPVTTMIDLGSGTRIVHTIAAAPDSRWLLATRGGYGFAAKLSDMVSRQRAGKQFITLEEGDELLRPVPLFDGAKQLALLSHKGKFLVFGLDEVKTLSGGGRGTILMGLDGTDKLDQTVPIGAGGLRAAGIYRNKHTEDILAGDALAPYIGKRARKGRALDVRPKQPVVLSPVLG